MHDTIDPHISGDGVLDGTAYGMGLGRAQVSVPLGVHGDDFMVLVVVCSDFVGSDRAPALFGLLMSRQYYQDAKDRSSRRRGDPT